MNTFLTRLSLCVGRLFQRIPRTRTSTASARSLTNIDDALARVAELEETNYFLLTILLAEPTLHSVPQRWLPYLREIVSDLPPEAKRRIGNTEPLGVTRVQISEPLVSTTLH